MNKMICIQHVRVMEFVLELTILLNVGACELTIMNSKPQRGGVSPVFTIVRLPRFALVPPIESVNKRIKGKTLGSQFSKFFFYFVPEKLSFISDVI